jgi:hypothetical protein
MIINAFVAALFAKHLAECPSREGSVVKLLPANTQRVVEPLVGSCGETVNGDAEVVDSKLRHAATS